MQYFLGIDNGLTVSKAVLFDKQGTLIGAHKSASPVKDGRIDMETLWDITAANVNNLLSDVNIDPCDVLGVCVSAHGNGLYPIGKDGEIFTDAIIPMTKEPQYIVDSWNEMDFAKGIREASYQQAWAGQPLPILAYLKENKPEIYKKTAYALLAKDFIKYKLTGAFTSEYTDATAAGLADPVKKEYCFSLIKKLGLSDAADKLPKLINSTDVAGYITKKAAEKTGLCEGTPVAGGLMDVDACVIGSGVITDDRYSLVAGTWAINSGITDKPVNDENVLQCCAYANGKYITIESSPTSCVNLEWFLKSFPLAGGFSEADRVVAENNGNDIIFLPYIYGSTKSPSLSGAFFGLDAGCGYADMLTAVFEGVVFGHRYQVEQLKKAGIVHNSAVLSGGAANSAVWSQMFADVLGIQISTVREKETGALGDAAVCSVMCGVYQNLDVAIANMVHIGAVYTPDDSRRDYYEEKYRRFENLVNRLSKGI